MKVENLEHDLRSLAHRKAPGADSTAASDLGYVHDQFTAIQDICTECMDLIEEFREATDRNEGFEETKDIWREMEDLRVYRPVVEETREKLVKVLAKFPGGNDKDELEQREVYWEAQLRYDDGDEEQEGDDDMPQPRHEEKVVES